MNKLNRYYLLLIENIRRIKNINLRYFFTKPFDVLLNIDYYGQYYITCPYCNSKWVINKNDNYKKCNLCNNLLFLRREDNEQIK